MEWIPGGDVHDGLGPTLPRGGAGASRDRRRVLDRSLAGDERALPAVRRGDRLRHAGRDRARRARSIPGADPSVAGPGVGRVREAGRARRPPRITSTGGRSCRAPTGATRTVRTARSRASTIIPWCTSASTTPTAYAQLGRQGAADRGGVGVRRARRPRRRRVRLGRRARARRQADGQQLAGRFPHREPAPRRLRGHVAGRGVPPQRLGPLRHDRQRLGVDDATGTRPSTSRKRQESRNARLLQRRATCARARAQLRSVRGAADSRAR